MKEIKKKGKEKNRLDQNFNCVYFVLAFWQTVLTNNRQVNKNLNIYLW